MCLLPGFDGIEEEKGFVLVINLVCQTDEISDNLVICSIVNSVNRLISRICHFFRIFGQLNLRNEFACFPIQDSGQLVHSAEGRAVLGGDQVGSHAPGVDGSSLNFQAVDQILVQIVGRGNDGVCKSGRIQHGLGLFRQISQIAAV